MGKLNKSDNFTTKGQEIYGPYGYVVVKVPVMEIRMYQLPKTEDLSTRQSMK